MNLKSTDIVTLHAYLPPQHAVKAKSAPFYKAGAKLMPIIAITIKAYKQLIKFNNHNLGGLQSFQWYRILVSVIFKMHEKSLINQHRHHIDNIIFSK